MKGDQTYHSKQIRIPIQPNNAERVKPLPESVHLLRAREIRELVCAPVVDRFGLEEDDEEGGGAGEGRLQPEDVAPGTEGDDYAADEGTWVVG